MKAAFRRRWNASPILMSARASGRRSPRSASTISARSNRGRHPHRHLAPWRRRARPNHRGDRARAALRSARRGLRRHHRRQGGDPHRGAVDVGSRCPRHRRRPVRPGRLRWALRGALWRYRPRQAASASLRHVPAAHRALCPRSGLLTLPQAIAKISRAPGRARPRADAASREAAAADGPVDRDDHLRSTRLHRTNLGNGGIARASSTARCVRRRDMRGLLGRGRSGAGTVLGQVPDGIASILQINVD